MYRLCFGRHRIEFLFPNVQHFSHVVDKVSIASVPGRSDAKDPIPTFEMTVTAQEITFLRFSGPALGRISRRRRTSIHAFLGSRGIDRDLDRSSIPSSASESASRNASNAGLDEFFRTRW